MTMTRDVDRLDRHTVVVASTLVLGGLMVVLDVTVTNVAIGRLSQAMRAPLPVIQWVVTGYTLALATVVPTAASAVRRFGAKRVYLFALGLFMVGSVLTGLAWDVQALIAFRVLQGLGGGLVMPVGMTIALRAAKPSQRGRVMGILGIPGLIGPVLGPTLGGWLMDALSWQWIFFVNLPVGVLAVILVGRLLPSEPSNPARRVDLAGLLLLSTGLAALVYGLATAGEHGAFLEADVLLPVLGGAGLVAGFLVRALIVAYPAVDVRLLRLRPMAAGAGVLTTFAAAYFGSMFLTPLYYQLARGMSATAAGALMIPQALATGITMQVASRLVDRVSARSVVGVGAALAASGYLGAAVTMAEDTPLWLLVGCLTVGGVGVGATLMPTITTATRQLDHDAVPSGTTLLTMGNQVAVSIGTAVISVLLTMALRDGLPQVAETGAGALYGLSDAQRQAVAPLLADAFQAAFTLPVALMAISLLITLLFLPAAIPHALDEENR
ncbi:MAG: DHA2 family efflux MFS transporter permease subunit [Micromonosporaceae bacterium]